MSNHSSTKPAITFLYSATGGGHRAAADAIAEAIHAEYGNALVTKMVDFLKDYAPPPFNHLPDLYSVMAKMPRLWGTFFDLSNGRAQTRLMSSFFWPLVSNAANQLVRDHQNDVLVSVHPVVNYFALNALGAHRLPYVTVVTDLVSTHTMWFDRRADLIFVPTEMARQRALQFGTPPNKIRLAGQPVSIRYSVPACDRREIRAQLGWPQDRQTILLVGGGEGMGPLAEIAHAIDGSGLDTSLVIVTGSNARLKETLQNESWKNPTSVYGFVTDMPDFMRGADILVTKAGPGTIAEALIAGLPIIIYAKLYGQENGNVDFVEKENLGVWAPEPAGVVNTLRRWISQPREREAVVENCRRVARPEASRTIAHLLAARASLIDLPQDIAANPLPAARARRAFRRLRPDARKV